jgi:hypothetical protein
MTLLQTQIAEFLKKYISFNPLARVAFVARGSWRASAWPAPAFIPALVPRIPERCAHGGLITRDAKRIIARAWRKILRSAFPSPPMAK